MKGSFLNKIPGPYEEKFAGVRAFYTYMLAHPGKNAADDGQRIRQVERRNYCNRW